MQTTPQIQETPAFRTLTRSACFAIVWVRGLDNQDHTQSLVEEIDAHEGVRSARLSRAEPCIMSVDYDPLLTRSREILDVINRPGVRAQIVGC